MQNKTHDKKNGKMSFTETIQFLITGKKPEPKNINPEELEEQESNERNNEGNNEMNDAVKEKELKLGRDQEEKEEGEEGKEGEKTMTKQASKKQPASKKSDTKPKSGESFTQKLQNSMQTHTETLVEEGLPLESDINDDERVFAGISYFPFLSFFVITTRKDSAYVMYHAWQGFAFLAVFLASLPFYFLLSFLPLMGFLFWLFYFVLFGFAFFAGFMAWSGRYVTVPFISGFAKTLSGR